MWSLAWSPPLWRRSPSRGAHGATACGAALALLAPAQSCRCARGGVAFGRRTFAALACSHGAVRRAQKFALSASGRWPGHFPCGGGRRRAALTAPRPAALCWHFWLPALFCRRERGGVTFGRRFSQQRLALLAQCVVLSDSRSLHVVVGVVASSQVAVTVARRPRRRCLRHCADTPGAGSVVPLRSRWSDARPPPFRGGGSCSRRVASCSAARAFCVWSLAWSLFLWRRSPSHGAHGAAACSTALALLAPALSCRRARGGVALVRRSFVAAARFRSAACCAWRLAPLRVDVRAVASSLEAVAVARGSRRHGLRRCVGAPGAGLVVPPR